MDQSNFLFVNWHNGRELTVVENTDKMQITMRKHNEDEIKLMVDKSIFSELMDLDWVQIIFTQLAFSQTPTDFIYKPPVTEDNGLKTDSRFTTIIFHQQSKFLKFELVLHGISSYCISGGSKEKDLIF